MTVGAYTFKSEDDLDTETIEEDDPFGNFCHLYDKQNQKKNEIEENEEEEFKKSECECESECENKSDSLREWECECECECECKAQNSCARAQSTPKHNQVPLRTLCTKCECA